MPEQLTLHVLDVAHLANEHRIADLNSRLAAARVAIIPDGERLLVPERAWLDYVGDAIRAYSPPGLEAPASTTVPTPPTDDLPDDAADWGPRRREQLRRNPRLQPLLDDFTRFIEERVPGIGWQQNLWTRTFVTPDGIRSGLKLRATKGLLLYNKRGAGKEMYVRSSSDFETALMEFFAA